jgi:hypothetical protein
VALPLLSRCLEEPDRLERIRGAAARRRSRILRRARPRCDGGSG